MIRAEDVHLTLRAQSGPVNVLRGIDLEVAAGSSIGVVGPSGSGKSSLLALLAGLERPTHGRIFVDGVEISALNENERADWRRRELGILFQSFHLISTLTALENVAVPLELAGDWAADAHAREALDAVGLGHRLDHRPTQLSGGEQQRVALARALVAKPRLVLADEPTGNLDGDTASHMADLLFSAVAEAGATLLLITHDPALAARCDRIAQMANGKLVQAPSPRVEAA